MLVVRPIIVVIATIVLETMGHMATIVFETVGQLGNHCLRNSGSDFAMSQFSPTKYLSKSFRTFVVSNTEFSDHLLMKLFDRNALTKYSP